MAWNHNFVTDANNSYFSMQQWVECLVFLKCLGVNILYRLLQNPSNLTRSTNVSLQMTNTFCSNEITAYIKIFSVQQKVEIQAFIINFI